MSEEFAFLDELLANINSENYGTKLPVKEDKIHEDPSKKSIIRSEFEEKLRRENAKLRSFSRHYRKTLNEREARLTELLKEKLSMKEEQGQIQECRKKLEEANLYIQATEQLNKQLHELAKTYENDKKILGEKIDQLRRKVKKLKKEVNGTTQLKLQERKKRLKLLKIIIELSEILISLGLLPVKYKRSLDGWKFEFKHNEDELEGGDVEEGGEEVDGEEKSTSNLVQASKSKKPPQAISNGPREEAPLGVMSDSEASGDERGRTSRSPAKSQSHGAPIISSVKALYNRLINSTDEMLRAGSDFGSTATSPCSSVSFGDQSGMGSSFGSEGSSGSNIFSPLTSIASKSLTSDVGRTEKGADLFSEEEWHLDHSSMGSPNADVPLVDEIDKGKESCVKKNEKKPKKNHSASMLTGSSNSSNVDAILKEMQMKLPSLLQPFELGNPCSPISREMPPTSIDDIEVQRRNGISSMSPARTNSLSNTISKLAPSRFELENTVNIKGASSAENEVCGSVTSVATGSSANASPIRDLSVSENENCRIGSKALDMNVLDSNCNGKSSNHIPHSQRIEVDTSNEVSCDLSTTVSTVEGESGYQSENIVDHRSSRPKRGKNKLIKSKKGDHSKENKSREKRHCEKRMEENAVERNPSGIKNKSPIKEDSPRRFSARLRNKSVSPNLVNISEEVPSEEDKQSSMDNNCDITGKLHKREAESQKINEALPLVDYSDSSDTCDSVLNTSLVMGESIFNEPGDNTSDIAKEQAVDVTGSLSMKLLPGQSENDSVMQTRSQKQYNLMNSSIGDSFSALKDIDASSNPKKPTKSVREFNDLENPKDVLEFSDARNVVSLSTMESNPSVMEFSESAGDEENNASASHLIKSSKNDGSMKVANSDEVDWNSCPSEEDQGSDKSELNGDASPVSVHSEELSQDVGITSQSQSPFLFSSDESGDEYSDALSMLDDCEGVVKEIPIISVSNDANDNVINTSREDFVKPVSVVPVLSDSISSVVKAPARIKSLVYADRVHRNLPDNQREVVSTPAAPDSHKSSGISFPEESGRIKINEKILSLENDSCENVLVDPQDITNNSIHNKCKQIVSNVESAVVQKPLKNPITGTSREKVVPVESTVVQKPGEKLITLSVKSTVVEEYAEKPITGNLTNSALICPVKQVCLSQGDWDSICDKKSKKDHRQNVLGRNNPIQGEMKESSDVSGKEIYYSTEDTDAICGKNEGKSKKDHIVNNLSTNNAAQGEVNETSDINIQMKVENPLKISNEDFNSDKDHIKKSLLHGREPMERHSRSIVGSSHAPTSPLEKGMNLFSAGPLRKIVSFIGGNTMGRFGVPFFFGKCNLFQFPGVKFRLSGHLAPEFYPDPYSFPRNPLWGFGGSDFVEFYEMIRSKVDETKAETLQQPGIKFYRQGSFAPPGYTDLYLCPRRLTINFDHRRCKRLNYQNEEGDEKSKEAELNVLSNDDCLPCPSLPSVDEEVSSDSSGTLCNDSDTSFNSSSEISVGSDVPINCSDLDDNCMELDHVSPMAESENVEVFNGCTQVLHSEKFNEKATSLDRHADHLDEKASSLLHPGSEMSRSQGLALDSPTFSQETPCIGPAHELMESTSHGENTSSVLMTEVISHSNGSVYDVNTTIANNQETENAGLTQGTKMSSHNSQDSLFIDTNTHESSSSGGYSSDKGDSPRRSVVDAAVSENIYNYVEEKPSKELCSTDIEAKTPIRVNQSVPSNSPGIVGRDSPSNTGHEDRKLVDYEHSDSEVDVEEADSSSKGNSLSDFEKTSRILGHNGENSCHTTATRPAKDLRVLEETDNENFGLIPDLESPTSVQKAKNYEEKSEEGKSVEKVDDDGSVNDSGIGYLFTTMGSGDHNSEVTSKSDGSSNDGDILVINNKNIFDVVLPLGSSSFSEKAEGEKQNVINCSTHANENDTGEACKEKMKQLAELQAVDGVFSNSFSDESAYSSLSRSVVSGPGSVDSAQIVASSQEPDLNLKERVAESIHIDKCLMAESLDDLIELAGGLPSFDDACLGTVATEVPETIAEANLLTKRPTNCSGELNSENDANQSGSSTVDLEVPLHNPVFLKVLTTIPTGSEGMGVNPISSAQGEGELKKDDSIQNEEDGLHTSSVAFDSVSRIPVETLASDSGHDFGSYPSDEKHFNSAESGHSCTGNLNDKNSEYSSEVVSSGSEYKDGTSVKTVRSEKGPEHEGIECAQSLVIGDDRQYGQAMATDGVIVEKDEINDSPDESGPQESLHSELLREEKEHEIVGEKNHINATIKDMGASPSKNLGMSTLVAGAEQSSEPSVEDNVEKEVENVSNVSQHIMTHQNIDMADPAPSVVHVLRENTKGEVTEFALDKAHFQINGSDANPGIKPLPEDGGISSNLAVSHGERKSGERKQPSDQTNQVKVENVIGGEVDEESNIPGSSDCGLVCNVFPEESESSNSIKNLLNAKKDIATKVAKKDLFGTEFSDSSSDSSETLASLLVKNRRKRKTRAKNSPKEDKKRKVEKNKVQHPRTKRPATRRSTRKSVKSKSEVICDSMSSSSDSVESPVENVKNASQSPPRNIKLERSSDGNHTEMDKWGDNLHETNNDSRELRNNCGNSDASVDKKPVVADSSDGMKSDDNNLIVSSDDAPWKSHLPLQSAPSRPGVFQKGNTVSGHVYACRKSNATKHKPTILMKSRYAEERDISLPENSTNPKLVQVDDLFNPADLSCSEDKKSPGNSNSRAASRRKQNLVSELKCDDAVILGVEELKAMNSEPISRPRGKYTPRAKKKIDSSFTLKKEKNGNDDSINKGGENNDLCEKPISSGKDSNALHLGESKKAPVITAVSSEVRKSYAGTRQRNKMLNEDNLGNDEGISEDGTLNPPLGKVTSNDPVESSLAAEGVKLPLSKASTCLSLDKKHNESDGSYSEEQDDHCVVKEGKTVDAAAMVMSKGNEKRVARSEKEAAIELYKESNVKDTSILEKRDHHQPSESSISFNCTKPSSVSECESISLSKTQSNSISKEKDNEVESGEEQNGKKIFAVERSPEVEHSKEKIDKEVANYLDESGGKKSKKRVAHVPKTLTAVVGNVSSRVNKSSASISSKEINNGYIDEDFSLPCKKKNSLSKVSAPLGNLRKGQQNDCISKSPVKEVKNDAKSKEQIFSLPLKKRIANLPHDPSSLTKLSPISTSNEIVSEEMGADEMNPLEGEDEYKPLAKNRVAHAPKLAAEEKTLNAFPQVNESASDTSMNRIKKKSIDSQEQGLTPPTKRAIARVPKSPSSLSSNHSPMQNRSTSFSSEGSGNIKDSIDPNEPCYDSPAKKRIAHSPTTRSKSSNADYLDSCLSENECFPDIQSNSPCSKESPMSNLKRKKNDQPIAKKRKARTPKLTTLEETFNVLTLENESVSDTSVKGTKEESLDSQEQEFTPTRKKCRVHIPRTSAFLSFNHSPSQNISSTLNSEESSINKTTKKCRVHIPNTSASLSSDLSPSQNISSTMNSEESGISKTTKKCRVHIPITSASLSSDRSPSQNISSTLKSEECGIGKDSLGPNEPFYNPPTKKRIAHSAKTCSKTSNADNLGSSLSENESLPDVTSNPSCSKKSPVKKTKCDKPRPKAKMSKLSKLRNMVSKMKGYRPTSVANDASAPRNIHRGSGCCSRKDSPVGGGGENLKISPVSGKQLATHQSTRRKLEECESSPKKRRKSDEIERELLKPDRVDKNSELEAATLGRQLPGLDGSKAASKSNEEDAEIDEKPALTGLWQVPLLVSPLKGASPAPKKKDVWSGGAVEEKMLEEMEVPPLSPLSEDEFVDALIEYPDSSESLSDGDINQTPEFHSTPKSHPKEDVKVDQQCNLVQELPASSDIAHSLEDSNNPAGKNLTDIYSVQVDNAGKKETVEIKLEILHETNASIDTEYIIDEGIEFTVTGDGCSIVPPQADSSSVASNGNTDVKLGPSEMREKLVSLSSGWHEKEDYFYKLLTEFKEEDAARRKEPDEPSVYVSRDKRRLLKTQFKKLNGQYFGNNLLKEILEVIDDPQNGYQCKHLAKYLVRMLSKEDEDDVQRPALPGAPRVTPFQMRVLSLILVLENRCPKFKDLCGMIFRGIQHALFWLGHCPPVEVLKPLARFYTALCMAKRDIWRARCFIFDALFGINTKAVELISIVLSMWHEVLPRQESNRDPSHLESSIFMSIFHLEEHKYGSPQLIQNIESLKMILRNLYNSEHHKKTYDIFLNELLSAIRECKNVDLMESAMILVAKRQGWEWTHKNLLCSNLVSVMDSWKGNKPSSSAAVMAIKLIGLLSRSCPLETSGPVKNIIEALSHALIKEPCDDPAIKEAVVLSLLRLWRFHTYHIVRAIDVWRPMRDPPEEVVKAIKGFVLRNSMKGFWRDKYRKWKRNGKGPSVPYFALSNNPELGNGNPEPGNGGGGGEHSDGLGSMEVSDQVKKKRASIRNNQKYKVWVMDENNAQSVSEEMRDWKRMAFPMPTGNNKRNRNKNKNKNKKKNKKNNNNNNSRVTQP